jgi:hypothetical protein
MYIGQRTFSNEESEKRRKPVGVTQLQQAVTLALLAVLLVWMITFTWLALRPVKQKKMLNKDVEALRERYSPQPAPKMLQVLTPAVYPTAPQTESEVAVS